jgi:hypothetical protein
MQGGLFAPKRVMRYAGTVISGSDFMTTGKFIYTAGGSERAFECQYSIIEGGQAASIWLQRDLDDGLSGSADHQLEFEDGTRKKFRNLSLSGEVARPHITGYLA